MKKSRLYGAVGLFAGIIMSIPVNAELISVDFGYAGSPMLFSGMESQAAALDPLFANSSLWNGIGLNSDWNQPPTNDPTYSNLSDNNGDSTGVSFSVLGAVNSFNYSAYYSQPAPGPLHGDYWFFNSRDASSSIDWYLSGLVPGAEYRMVFYGANHDQDRVFDMTVDTDGDGDFSDEAALPVQTLAGAFPAPTYLASVFASDSGEIFGRADGTGSRLDYAYEANWSGFQIASAVPIPPALWLFGSGLLGLIGVARRTS
jgi:hypothetical protein